MPLGLLLTCLSLGTVCCSRQPPLAQVLAAYQETKDYPSLTIRYPQEGTVFPPEIVPCTFSWQDTAAGADTWLILVQFQAPPGRRCFLSRRAEWTPGREDWEQLKRRSRENPARVTVLGFAAAAPLKILSRGRVSLSTSADEVGAPLFYREVNLPFMEAVKDPTRIRWRFGSIAAPQQPAVVLQRLPVCGNCHSFSRDGKVLGMDVDYANNKGSYVITRVAREMTLATSQIITWDAYRPEDRQQTFGLLSQVSPDGRNVISTVKDKSVFVGKPDLAFSQLFFPIKGILVVYHRNTGAFQSLPGADDPEYVQSNPVWSPDGQYIVFARTKAYQLRSADAEGKLLLSEADCAEFLREGKPFRFDLYRIPYHDGRGGQAEPLAGASRNGRSNFFPKYSPDGQWIVFCQASNYMLLQPDSELYIIPAAGGQARRLRGNTSRLNSWHSWSPNGRWLVFASKANSPYTQLFLTHIDPQGESTPPVLLAHFTAPDRAANIPEFVNAQPGAIGLIRERFLDDYSHARAAYVLEVSGDPERAIAEYRKALQINPRSVQAHQRLGFLLFHLKHQFKEGLAHTTEALRLDPADGCAHYDLGMALRYQGQPAPAVQHLAEAVRLLPAGFDRRYNPADMQAALGDALLAKGDVQQAVAALTKALNLDPQNARTHYLLALALAAQGNIEESLKHYAVVQAQRPDLDTAPELHLILSVHYAEAGRMQQALASARKALQLAQARGDAEQVGIITRRIEEYRAQTGPQR
ncbi:MAG: tetratricopeptide repeat protein [Verrucomicrobiota bacterium]|jgi:tetratricopeptide (TPR) repeat protein